LGAFLDDTQLRRLDAELAANLYRTHEFGDSLLIERGASPRSGRAENAHPHALSGDQAGVALVGRSKQDSNPRSHCDRSSPPRHPAKGAGPMIDTANRMAVTAILNHSLPSVVRSRCWEHDAFGMLARGERVSAVVSSAR